MTDEYRCELCGELMPPGETMFKFHGYSGPCPKEPLPRPAPINWQERAERAEAEVATCKVCRAINLAADDMPDEIRRLRERIAALEAERDALRLVVTAAQEMREECRFVSAGPLYDSVFAFDASLAAPEGFGAIDTRDGFGLAGIASADKRIAAMEGTLDFVANAIGHDPARTPELSVALSERLDRDQERIAALEKDAERIDALQAWLDASKAKGFVWDQYHFMADKTVRESLDDARAALKEGK